MTDPFVSYLTERVQAFPDLSIERLLREIRAMGYKGGRTVVGDRIRAIGDRAPSSSVLLAKSNTLSKSPHRYRKKNHRSPKVSWDTLISGAEPRFAMSSRLNSMPAMVACVACGTL